MALAISGDPVVGRLLVLLLEDSGHKVGFLPRASLNEPGALEGVRLLILTPTPDLTDERRAALLASLMDTQEATGLTVMELVTLPEEMRREEPREELPDDSWHRVPWPTGIAELKRRIEAALLANPDPGADPAAKIDESEDKVDGA